MTRGDSKSSVAQICNATNNIPAGISCVCVRVCAGEGYWSVQNWSCLYVRYQIMAEYAYIHIPITMQLV